MMKKSEKQTQNLLSSNTDMTQFVSIFHPLIQMCIIHWGGGAVTLTDWVWALGPIWPTIISFKTKKQKMVLQTNEGYKAHVENQGFKLQ